MATQEEKFEVGSSECGWLEYSHPSGAKKCLSTEKPTKCCKENCPIMLEVVYYGGIEIEKGIEEV